MHILEVGRQRKRYVLKKERKKRRWNEVENRISVGDGGIAVYAWANRNLMDYTESGHSPFLQTLGRRATERGGGRGFGLKKNGGLKKNRNAWVDQIMWKE